METPNRIDTLSRAITHTVNQNKNNSKSHRSYNLPLFITIYFIVCEHQFFF